MTTREFIDRFKKSTGRLPSQVELSKQLKLSPQSAIKALIQYTREAAPVKEEVKIEDRQVVLNLLRIFLVFLSAMAFGLSVYFTGLWFYGRFHIVVSGTISLTMVLFMVISPQALRFIDNPAIKAVVYLSFTVALVFSMGSTVAGQYQKTTLKQEVTVDNSSLFNHYETRKAEILSLLEDERKNRQVHVDTLQALSVDREKNAGMLRTERAYIKISDERIDSFNAELQEINDKMETSLESGSVEERKDFFSFLSLLTGREKNFIEFIVSALPSLFIDIIAALSLNLALYIGGRKDVSMQKNKELPKLLHNNRRGSLFKQRKRV